MDRVLSYAERHGARHLLASYLWLAICLVAYLVLEEIAVIYLGVLPGAIFYLVVMPCYYYNRGLAILEAQGLI